MTLQETIQELEAKLLAIATQGLEIPAELAEHLEVFDRAASQMLVMMDEVLAVASLKPESHQSISNLTNAPDLTDPDSLEQPAEISVLLVEDNLVNRKLAVLILEKIGCRVDAALNGEEGVEKFKAGNYVAIFMDCQMPVMDGYEATRAIRELEKADGSHIPIIAVTANAMKGDREKCLECGMDDYIAKPLLPNDLNEAVSRWCRVPV